VTGGLFNLTMNKTLGTLYGEPVDVDFSSSMRLLEVPNLFTMWETMATMNMDEILKGSPSLSMVVGDNGKFGNLVKSIGRVFTVPEDDGRYKDVGVNFLNMFSGASNFMKARYIIKKGQSVNTKGVPVDNDVNEIEAMMRVAGFATTDEMMKYAMDEKTYKASKRPAEDVKYAMDEMAKRLGRDGISVEETDYIVDLYREANRIWGDDPFMMELVQKDIQRRGKAGDHVVLNRLIDMAGAATEEEMRQAISLAPMPSEDKKKLLEIIDFMKQEDE
jgi:hypothetical protein